MSGFDISKPYRGKRVWFNNMYILYIELQLPAYTQGLFPSSRLEFDIQSRRGKDDITNKPAIINLVAIYSDAGIKRTRNDEGDEIQKMFQNGSIRMIMKDNNTLRWQGVIETLGKTNFKQPEIRSVVKHSLRQGNKLEEGITNKIRGITQLQPSTNRAGCGSSFTCQLDKYLI